MEYVWDDEKQMIVEDGKEKAIKEGGARDFFGAKD